jgi:hypothetical protein
MQILTTIFRDPGLNLHGKTDHRTAVRAVAIRRKKLLMVYSPVNGDYKFPGGGVSKKERLMFRTSEGGPTRKRDLEKSAYG